MYYGGVHEVEWTLRCQEGKNSHFNVDVVPGDNLLSTNRADLDLYVDDAKGFRAHVDLDQTWVYGLVELTKT